MNRITPLSKETASPKALEILTGVEKALGIVPNMIATMAHSPTVASAYLAFSHTLAQGSLPAKIRERIALAVGEANGCDYCLSAHTLLGGKAGLGADEIVNARRGTSEEPKIAAALAFARKVVETRGGVTDDDVADLRAHGFTDGEITEIIANVALSIFTNYFNIAVDTEIDFPRAPKLAAL